MSTHFAKSKFQIGSIVALKTHFYSYSEDSNTIIIGGEPKLISPLLVVVEILKKMIRKKMIKL